MRNFYKMGYIDGIDCLLSEFKHLQKYKDVKELSIEDVIHIIETIKEEKAYKFSDHIPNEKVDAAIARLANEIVK